jgi:hypothetical protein
MKTRKTIRSLEKLADKSIHTLGLVCADLHDRNDGEQALRRVARESARLDETLDGVATRRALDHLRPRPEGLAVKKGERRAERYARRLEALCARVFKDFAALEDLLDRDVPLARVLYRAQLALDRLLESLEAAKRLCPARRAVASGGPAGPPAFPAPPPELNDGEAAA